MTRTKRLLCFLAPFCDKNVFAERIWIWGNFISRNGIREDHNIVFLLPTSYNKEITLYEHFQLHEIRFYSLEDYNKIYLNERSAKSFLLKNLIESRFDIILTCSNEPALRMEFPLALFLHFELGILSRPPAPWLLQYDQLGLYEESSFKILGNIELDEEVHDDIRLVSRLGRQSIEILSRSSYKSMSPELTKFLNIDRDVYLLPMPRLPDPTMRNFVGKELSEGELISLVALAIPPDAQLIVTQHPSSATIKDGAPPALNNSNVLIVAPGSGFNYSHEYFPFIKSVITINSMVGAQAKLAGKLLYCSYKSGLSAISDGYIELEPYPRIVNKDLYLETHELIIGYILSFLHLPQGIWDSGYGRAYIEHFLNGGTVLNLASNKNTRSIIPRVIDFYKAYILQIEQVSSV